MNYFLISTLLGFGAAAQEGETPETTKKKIEAMRVEDVVWRKIAWKKCIVEGLAASSKEQKPVILWVFIDRPIDDERC